MDVFLLEEGLEIYYYHIVHSRSRRVECARGRTIEAQDVHQV